MSSIKFLIISLTTLVLLLTAIAFLMPSTVRVSRVVSVMAPMDSVYNQLAFVENWDKWSPYKSDSSLQTQFSYATTGVESYYEIYKNNHLAGKFIVDSTKPSTITFYFEANGYPRSSGFFSVTSVDASQVLVEWRINVRLKWYPWQKFRGIFADKIFGPTLEAGLNNLKQLAEQ